MNSVYRSDEWTRRRFMERTATAFLGVGALGITSRGGAEGGGAGPVKGGGKAQRVIYLYMNGGMSQFETFYPKPGHENSGTTKAINTNVDGIQLAHLMPKMAKHGDKMAIIRSMISTTGAHESANYLMHTSYEQRATIRHPGIGAWALKFKNRLNVNLPGSVYVGGGSRINGGGGFFEPEYEPLAINDPNAGLRNSAIRGMNMETFDRRLKLSRDFDSEFHQRYDVKKLRAYTQMYDDAVRIMKSEDLKAFDLTKEDKEVRERYGNNPFGQGCLLARRLVDHDVRSVEVEFGGWDMHSNVFVSSPDRCGILDSAMSALIDDLTKSGKLADTLIVLTTEFGRTPKINQNAGRDHFPQAFCSVLVGGGIKGGVTYGKTDEAGDKIIENPVGVPQFNATVAHALGLPLDQILYSPSKRPFTVANKGVPVEALFV